MLKRLFVRLVPFLVVAAAAFAVGVWSNSAPCIDLRPVPVNPRHCDPGTIIIVADGEGIWSCDAQGRWIPPSPQQARFGRK